MPRENKKRGHREEAKKRKREENDNGTNDTPKRVKPLKDIDHLPIDNDDGQYAEQAAQLPDYEPTFYGLLTQEEEEYFKQADATLEADQFTDTEERNLFLSNVYHEAEGKELKMAINSSCSKTLERIMILSAPSQLKAIFKAFSGNFFDLFQHRFASHCCETLFRKGAPCVTEEMIDPEAYQNYEDPKDTLVPMESLYLQAVNDVKPHLGFLMTQQYASHALRILLLVLSGMPLDRSADKSLLQSRKKVKVDAPGQESDPVAADTRTVPNSFHNALEGLMYDDYATLDTPYVRSLGKHTVGNPTLQLMLRLEHAIFGRQMVKDERSIFYRLLPDENLNEESGSALFIQDLMYHPVGSRLLEAIIEHAPSKQFKLMYKQWFKHGIAKLANLSRFEIAAYVFGHVLERLGKDDLQECVAMLLPQFNKLLERGQHRLIQTLIERCRDREVDTSLIAAALEMAYNGANGFDITRLLRLQEVTTATTEDQLYSEDEVASRKYHGSQLAQKMVEQPGHLADLIYDSLARLGPALALKVARDPMASHALQAAMKSASASVIFRRKIIQQFYGHIGEMALDPSASHVIDAVWESTQGLAFIRERVAEELAENESSLRESFVGRAVWKNWQMDLYKRRRAEWVRQSRRSAGNDGFLGFPENDGKMKSSLEQARERHHDSKHKRKTSDYRDSSSKYSKSESASVTTPSMSAATPSAASVATPSGAA